jgi:hypothetical protein
MLDSEVRSKQRMGRESDTPAVLDVNVRQLAISCQAKTSKQTTVTDLREIQVRRRGLYEMKEKVDIKKKWHSQVLEEDE